MTLVMIPPQIRISSFKIPCSKFNILCFLSDEAGKKF
jgi:hypothetical protein